MIEMSYKVKSVFITIMFSLIFYFVIAGIFGSRGMIYNKSIGKQISMLMSEEDNLKEEIERLNKISDYLDTPEGKEKVASQLGYHFAGDYVYIYSASPIQTENNEYRISRRIDSSDFYKPLSNKTCFIIALIPSLVLGISYFFVMKSRETNTADYTDKTGTDIEL